MSAPERQVIVEARPQPLTIDPWRSAVIVVDMQNEFGTEIGAFAQAGIDISSIQAAMSPIAHVLTAARLAGVTVVYVKTGFRPDLSDAGAPEAPNWLKHLPFRPGEAVTAPDGSASRFFIRDTWNTDILPELAPQPDDVVIYKHRLSGFYETELDAILKSRSIKDLIFTGCTTCGCVESTLRDAMYRDYRCLILQDCTAEPLDAISPLSHHDAALLVVELLLGWVSTSPSLITALQGQRLAAPA